MTYADIARETISEFGMARILEFLGHVKPSYGRGCVAHIRINGFRRGSDSEYQRQRAMLARRLAKDGADQPATEKDWQSLARFWAAWAVTEFEDPKLLDLTKSYFDPVVNPDEIVPNIVRVLGRLTREKIISCDQLELYVAYAPFQVPSDAYSEILESAVDSAAVEEAKAVRRLPDRVSELEKRLDTLADTTGEIKKLSAEIQLNSDAALRLGADLHSNAERFDGFDLKVVETAQNIERLSALASDAVNHQLDAKAAVDALRDSLADVRQKTADLESLIHEASAKIDATRVAETQHRTLPASNAERSQTALNSETLIGMRPCTVITEDNIFTAQGLESVLDGLRDNLSAMGLTKASSEQLASEVLSGFVAQQLVSFAGSLSLLVAQVCAVSFAGRDVSIVDVPLGFSDRVSLDSATSDVDVILNNANVGTFELYAATFCTQIVQSQFGSRSGSQRVRFATLTPPPIGLPQEIFSSIGPIIDTDVLLWTESSFRKPIKPTRAVFDHPPDIPNQARDFWSDLDECFEKAGKARSELWRRVVINGYSAMSSLPTSNDEGFREASMLASWVIPYWRSHGMVPKALSEMLTTAPALAGALTSNKRLSGILR